MEVEFFMAISESLELLGKELYAGSGIPETLTLSAIPTVSELEFVSSEDFDKTMIESILPQAIEEKIDFGSLLEIDYHWLLRCLRILNYGPYITVNTIYCPKCGRKHGEFECNLNTIACKPLPEGFKNKLRISKDEFLEFNQDVEIHMLTIKEVLMAQKDTAFKRENGLINRDLARMCYMITSIGGQPVSPVDARLKIQNKMISADYLILKNRISELTDYGIRVGGDVVCPTCRSTATFIALVNDKFFRPTLGDLRTWKNDRNRRNTKDTARSKTKDV